MKFFSIYLVHIHYSKWISSHYSLIMSNAQSINYNDEIRL